MLPLDNCTGTLLELISPAQSDLEMSLGKWEVSEDAKFEKVPALDSISTL